MSVPIQIWVEACHNTAHRCGGWAYVRRDPDGLTGAAGGERGVGSERAALAALAAALKDLPAGAEVQVLSADRSLQAAWRRLAELRADGEPPVADLDLWARLQAATQGRTARLAVATGSPAAFAR